MIKFGWKPPLADVRDVIFSSTLKFLKEIPKKVDLSEKFPEVYDQGELGSCTANAVCGIVDYLDTTKYRPSRLFLYYNTRKAQGTIEYDSGASIRETIKSVNREGVCRESSWKYDISKFKDVPSTNAYKNAKLHRSLSYRYIDNSNIDHIISALVEGFPIAFGFTVYSSFMNKSLWNNDIMPDPSGTVLGGHAVLIVGYNEDTQMLKIKNSWGTSWCNNGYFQMPYSFATSKNCADFWVIQQLNMRELESVKEEQEIDLNIRNHLP